MANPSLSWSVVHQQPATGQNDGGAYVKGQEVRIRTGQGHEGVVFLPYDIYGTDKGRQRIAALALKLDSVGSLTDRS